jgi:hypothetical protein
MKEQLAVSNTNYKQFRSHRLRYLIIALMPVGNIFFAYMQKSK